MIPLNVLVCPTVVADVASAMDASHHHNYLVIGTLSGKSYAYKIDHVLNLLAFTAPAATMPTPTEYKRYAHGVLPSLAQTISLKHSKHNCTHLNQRPRPLFQEKRFRLLSGSTKSSGDDDGTATPTTPSSPSHLQESFTFPLRIDCRKQYEFEPKHLVYGSSSLCGNEASTAQLSKQLTFQELAGLQPSTKLFSYHPPTHPAERSPQQQQGRPPAAAVSCHDDDTTLPWTWNATAKAQYTPPSTYPCRKLLENGEEGVRGVFIFEETTPLTRSPVQPGTIVLSVGDLMLKLVAHINDRAVSNLKYQRAHSLRVCQVTYCLPDQHSTALVMPGEPNSCVILDADQQKQSVLSSLLVPKDATPISFRNQMISWRQYLPQQGCTIVTLAPALTQCPQYAVYYSSAKRPMGFVVSGERVVSIVNANYIQVHNLLHIDIMNVINEWYDLLEETRRFPRESLLRRASQSLLPQQQQQQERRRGSTADPAHGERAKDAGSAYDGLESEQSDLFDGDTPLPRSTTAATTGPGDLPMSESRLAAQEQRKREQLRALEENLCGDDIVDLYTLELIRQSYRRMYGPVHQLLSLVPPPTDEDESDTGDNDVQHTNDDHKHNDYAVPHHEQLNEDEVCRRDLLSIAQHHCADYMSHFAWFTCGYPKYVVPAAARKALASITSASSPSPSQSPSPDLPSRAIAGHLDPSGRSRFSHKWSPIGYAMHVKPGTYANATQEILARSKEQRCVKFQAHKQGQILAMVAECNGEIIITIGSDRKLKIFYHGELICKYVNLYGNLTMSSIVLIKRVGRCIYYSCVDGVYCVILPFELATLETYIKGFCRSFTALLPPQHQPRDKYNYNKPVPSAAAKQDDDSDDSAAEAVEEEPTPVNLALMQYPAQHVDYSRVMNPHLALHITHPLLSTGRRPFSL